MAYISQRTYLGMRPHRALKRPLFGVDVLDAPNGFQYIELHPKCISAIHPKKEVLVQGLMHQKFITICKTLLRPSGHINMCWCLLTV